MNHLSQLEAKLGYYFVQGFLNRAGTILQDTRDTDITDYFEVFEETLVEDLLLTGKPLQKVYESIISDFTDVTGSFAYDVAEEVGVLCAEGLLASGEKGTTWTYTQIRTLAEEAAPDYFYPGGYGAQS